jgi:hypothetical protein
VVPDLPGHWRADAAAVSKRPCLVEAASTGLLAKQEKGVGLLVRSHVMGVVEGAQRSPLPGPTQFDG